MHKINEELIGRDSLKEQATEVEADELKSEVVGEQNEPKKNVLDEQLFDEKYNTEAFWEEENGDEQNTIEQMENPNQTAPQTSPQADEKEDEEVSMPDEDKIGAPETQAGTQTFPSESSNWMENLEFILDIPLQVDIQLGQTKIPLRELLEISSGSIIKLNKSKSDPIELLINGKLVAEGQIVVIDGNTLGIQVSSIVKRIDRIRSLR